MRLRVLLGALGLGALSVAAAARDARACGGCFHGPSQSGDVITDHRMIFRVTPQQTTLYDEIEYQGDPQSFAWVLPVHGTVTVGLSSDLVFQVLDQQTQTTIEAPNLPPCPSCSCQDAPGFGGSSSGGAASAADASAGAVTVTSQQTVGPYDTVQLQSTDPSALDNWLAQNGYDIPSDIQPIIAAYVNEGFDFLALRLAPGQGVTAMRPVRVTSPGAGLSLPLRMVAAGTGATVGITLWVLADGRYEPQNFPSFTIDPSQLVWDWNTQESNYTTVRAQKEASLNDAAWQIESSLDLSSYQIEQPIMYGDPNQNYLPVAGDDGGAGDGGAGESAEQVMQDDLATLFPGASQSSVRVTRIRADLSHAALANDLALQASADQSDLSNVYQVTQSVNAPACPAVPDPCPPCGGGSGGGVGSSGGGTGGPFGGGWFNGGGFGNGNGGGGGHSGCSTAPDDRGSGGVELVLAGLVAVGIFGKRGRRRA